MYNDTVLSSVIIIMLLLLLLFPFHLNFIYTPWTACLLNKMFHPRSSIIMIYAHREKLSKPSDFFKIYLKKDSVMVTLILFASYSLAITRVSVYSILKASDKDQKEHFR